MSIDSCYEEVIAKLTSQNKIIDISKKLLALKTESEKVLYVYSIVEELDAFPKVKEVKKTNKASLWQRNLGNKCFQQNEFYKAWQYYNLSLLYAPLDSENFCIAISNRSAVFFELKKYNECIQDIDKFFTLQYPERLSEKLKNRKQQSKEALLNQKHSSEIDDRIHKILKMKAEKDCTYVAASKKLRVVYNEAAGRHVIAKENINVGEVIVEEEPYFTILGKSEHLVACSYCLSRSLNLLPCDCCCFCLYCSDECKAKAWKDYHEIECPLIATLFELDFTKIELLALRTVIKARRDHLTWSDLFATIKTADERMNTEFHGQVKVDKKWIYDSKYYVSIHSLATNQEKRSVSDIFQKSMTVVVFLRFLLKNTNFMQSDCEEQSNDILKCVAKLLLIHEMTTPTNMHAITSNIEDKRGRYTEESNFASAPYAFSSLLNHSCAPNITRISILGTAKMLIFILRPIKKGMQIFDNYGFHHALLNSASRCRSLHFQYKFICSCEACVNNWPTYMELSMRMSRIVPFKLANAKNNLLCVDVINELELGNVNTALKTFKALCKLCEKLEDYAPCVELCDCQEALKQCLNIFGGLLPYSSKILVNNEA